MKPFVLNGMFDSISPPFTEHLLYSIYFMLPSGKESAYWFLGGVSCRSRKGCRFDSWVGKILWSRNWQSTPVFLPGKSHGQKSLAGYNPWGRKELDTNEWLSTLIHRQNKIIFKSKTMLPFTKVYKPSNRKQTMVLLFQPTDMYWVLLYVQHVQNFWWNCDQN